MPKGENFKLEAKQLMCHIIKFVDSEKNGPVIPLFNSSERLETMLGISRKSITRLRNEMLHLEMKEEAEKEKNEHEEEKKIQTRPRTVSDTVVLPNRSHRKRKYSIDIPKPSSPKKKGRSGRKVIELTEQQQDQIRYHAV